MNRPTVYLVLTVALLWRGLTPVGVMAMPGDSGFEIRLCGLNGGTVVLDLGIDPDDTHLAAADHADSPCPVGAGVGAMGLPSAVEPMLPQRSVLMRPASFLRDMAPRGPPLRVMARGPPPFI